MIERMTRVAWLSRTDAAAWLLKREQSFLTGKHSRASDAGQKQICFTLTPSIADVGTCFCHFLQVKNNRIHTVNQWAEMMSRGKSEEAIVRRQAISPKSPPGFR